jgi:RNA-binding protein
LPRLRTVLVHFATMKLTEQQKKFLRGHGHTLKPVVTVGDAGLSESLLAEFDSSIRHHELIKVRVRAADRDQRDAILEQLCTVGSAELIARIGNVALLFRPNEHKPRITLPSA